MRSLSNRSPRTWAPGVFALALTVLCMAGMGFGPRWAQAVEIPTWQKPTMELIMNNVENGEIKAGSIITYRIKQSLAGIQPNTLKKIQITDKVPDAISAINVRCDIDGKDPGTGEAKLFTHVDGLNRVRLDIYELGITNLCRYDPSPSTITFDVICTVGSKVAEGEIMRNTGYTTFFFDGTEDQKDTGEYAATVGKDPEYTLSMTASPAQAKQGDTVHYQAKLGNSGKGSGPNVTLSCTPPTGLTLSKGTVQVQGLDGGSYTVDQTSLAAQPPKLKITIPTLGPNADVTITFDATVGTTAAEGTKLTSTLSLEDGSKRMKDATAEVTVAKPALSLTKQAGAEAVDAGGQVSYTLTVRNTSTLASVNDVTVTDAPPTGLTIDTASVNVQGGSGSPQKNVTESSLEVQLGTLAPQGQATITYNATATEGAAREQQLSSSATATGTGVAQVQASAQVRVNGEPHLAFTMSGTTPSENGVDVGKSVTFEVTITNDSPVTVRNVAFENPIPSGLVISETPQVVTTGVERKGSGSAQVADGKVSATITQLSTNESAHLTYDALVTKDAAFQVTNTSTVAADEVDSQSQSYTFKVNHAYEMGIPQTGLPPIVGLLVGGGTASTCALAVTELKRRGIWRKR